MDENDMTTGDLARCAQQVRDGLAMMRAGHAQKVEGVLKAAEAIVVARDAKKNDAEFGKWCSDNGFGLDVIDKDNRAALIRIGRNLPYWRARLAAQGNKIGQSLRYLVKDIPDEEVSLAIPARHETKPGPKPAEASVAPKATADPVRSAPQPAPAADDDDDDAVPEWTTYKPPAPATVNAAAYSKLSMSYDALEAEHKRTMRELIKLNRERTRPSVVSTGAPFEIETFVLGYEARSAHFPSAPEIAEMLQIDEASAAKGLAAVVKARKDGLIGRVLFSDAQAQHVEAFEEGLKRRYYRLTEAEQRKLQLAQRQASIEISARAEQRAGTIRQFATDKLREWAEAHSMFTVEEWRLLNMAIQKNATDETRHDAALLLNERAYLATGGKMGKPDDIARAKRTRAEAEAEKAAKAKAAREAKKAAKTAATPPVAPSGDANAKPPEPEPPPDEPPAGGVLH